MVIVAAVSNSTVFPVSTRPRIAATSSAFAALLVACSAYSDGVCYRGYRDTTADERETMTAVLEAVRGALPMAPEGWVLQGDDALSVMTSICGDYALIPWQYDFGRHYHRLDDLEARQQKMEAAGELMREGRGAWRGTCGCGGKG